MIEVTGTTYHERGYMDSLSRERLQGQPLTRGVIIIILQRYRNRKSDWVESSFEWDKHGLTLLRRLKVWAQLCYVWPLKHDYTRPRLISGKIRYMDSLS